MRPAGSARAALPAALAPVNLYLLALVGAAAWGLRKARPAGAAPGRMRFGVVVPAHDEEATLGATLASLRAADYPADQVETIVIADNCSDRTAELAHAGGATVWERHETAGGKGAALEWGLARFVAERGELDAVVVVDADCIAAPNLLHAIEARLQGGAQAVQAVYEVANPAASTTAALRYASFALINLVRPLGRVTLGLSAGLFGTGMAFRRELLEAHPWSARSLVEDQEYHLALVANGVRVALAHDTWVRSPMPTTLARSRSQQLRWDSGRGVLTRSWTPRLLAAAARRRDPARLQAALEPLVPAQSVLLAANVAGAALALTGSRRTRLVGLANLGAQAAAVAGGLALARAPAPVWRALAFAPALAAWKLALLSRLWLGGPPPTWERTARETASVARTA